MLFDSGNFLSHDYMTCPYDSFYFPHIKDWFQISVVLSPALSLIAGENCHMGMSYNHVTKSCLNQTTEYLFNNNFCKLTINTFDFKE